MDTREAPPATLATAMELAEFEQIVRATLDQLPEGFRYALENVVIEVEDEPESGERDLFGLYEGTPLSERSAGHMGLPDRIRIFRGPILRHCDSREEMIAEIRDTVIHELGHHMGLDDHEMPY